MKKFLALTIIFLFISGCTQESNFALKEKCAKYLDTYTKQTNDICLQSSTGCSGSVMFVHYSNKLSTCIGKSIIMKWSPTTSAFQQNINYTDLLSGETVNFFDSDISNTESSSANDEKAANYEKELDLIN